MLNVNMLRTFINSRNVFALERSLKKTPYFVKYFYSTIQKEELTPLAQQVKSLISVHIISLIITLFYG